MTGPGNLPHLPTPTLLGGFKRVDKNTENGQHEALYYIYIFYCRASTNFFHLVYSIRRCFGKYTYACTVFLSQTPVWLCKRPGSISGGTNPKARANAQKGKEEGPDSNIARTEMRQCGNSVGVRASSSAYAQFILPNHIASASRAKILFSESFVSFCTQLNKFLLTN